VLALLGCGDDDGGGGAAAPAESTTNTSAPARDPAPTEDTAAPEVAVSQPVQPTCGPGGNDYEHGDWRISEGGTGSDGSAAIDDGRDAAYALGDTPEHRSNGEWSDGTEIAPLQIRDTAPIRP
jgi:hypothetical protein